MERHFRLQLLVIILVTFITGLIATFSFKQLFNDGSMWAFEIVNDSVWFAPQGYSRYLTLLLKAPAVILSRLGAPPGMTTWSFCFSYFIYPYLALIGLLRYRNNEKNLILLVPLLCFFMVIIPNWAFSVSIVNESIVLAWLVYCHIIFSPKPRLWFLTLISVAMLFTYESSFLFYLFFCYLLWREKKLSIAAAFVFAILTIVQLSNLFLMLIPANGHQHFKSSFLPGLHSPHLMMLLALFFLIGSWFARTTFAIRALVGGALCISILVSYKLITLPSVLLWHQSYTDRIWAIPVSGFLFLIVYEALRLKQFSLMKSHQYALILLLLPGMIHEFRVNYSQYTFSSRFRSFLESHPGCQVMPFEQWLKMQDGVFVPEWSVANLSVLHAQDKNIKSLLFVQAKAEDGALIEHPFCKIQQGHFLVYGDRWGHHRMGITGNLNFHEALKASNE